MADQYAIYVTVGVPGAQTPTMEKIRLWVNDKKGETPTQVAKQYRKKIADHPIEYGWMRGTKVKPSDLYYEIYGTFESRFPYAESANSPRLYLTPEQE